ncbi:MAG: biotin transporter BioY [Deltaproteobacteria bacterium]|nr:biotin transporter BioY [Deltaproteobacteria bacterium]
MQVSSISHSTCSVTLTRSLLALGFALLIGLGAHIKIYLPFTPVPMTFQTFFLLVGAAYLRRYYSLQMIAWYLLLGFVGFPLFANQSAGFAYLLGPTGGYLLGFVLAASLLGFFSFRNPIGQFFLFLLAHTILFVPGIFWLHQFLGGAWQETLAKGLYPFLFGDLLKSAAAFFCWFLFSKYSKAS